MSDLRCETVTLRRGDVTILGRVDAAFARGRVALVTGATGSGKSSLLHLCGGLIRPTSGVVWWGEAPVSRWTAGHRDRVRQRIGIALQAPHLLEDLTVAENVLLPLVPRQIGLREARQRTREALGRLAIPELASRQPRSLSGGQRQRVALARAWVTRPEILLVDEPTAHQDNAGAVLVAELLAEAARGGAVVLATAHDPRLVHHLDADRWRVTDGQMEELSG